VEFCEVNKELLSSSGSSPITEKDIFGTIRAARIVKSGEINLDMCMCKSICEAGRILRENLDKIVDLKTFSPRLLKSLEHNTVPHCLFRVVPERAAPWRGVDSLANLEIS
jgi:hypothetical protein